MMAGKRRGPGPGCKERRSILGFSGQSRGWLGQRRLFQFPLEALPLQLQLALPFRAGLLAHRLFKLLLPPLLVAGPLPLLSQFLGMLGLHRAAVFRGNIGSGCLLGLLHLSHQFLLRLVPDLPVLLDLGPRGLGGCGLRNQHHQQGQKRPEPFSAARQDDVFPPDHALF
jgi:hypothetical protein